MKLECSRYHLEPLQTAEDILNSTEDWKVCTNIECPQCGGDTVPVEEKKKKKGRKKKVVNKR